MTASPRSRDWTKYGSRGSSLIARTAASRRGPVVGQRRLGDLEGGVGGGYPRVHGGVQQDLGDLVRAQAVAAGGADVHRQLVVALQGGEQGERDAGPGTPVQAVAVPHLAPGGAGDELL